MKRYSLTIRILGAVLLGALFFGFSLAQSEPVRLTFWSWRIEDKWAYDQIIAGYEATHPGVDIEFMPFESSTYATVLSTAFAAGQGPDIAHVRAYGAFEAFAAPGFLLPLDDKVSELANFSELALNGERLRADGRVYAVPFASQTLVIYYNTAIFNQLGLTPPETWDQFLATCQALKANGSIPLANGAATAFMNEVLMGVFAPNFYGADFFNQVVAGETTFEDPRFTGALARLLELRPYLAPDFLGVDYTTAQSLFVNELAAMFAGGSWEIANFRRQNPDLTFDIFPGPVLEAGQPHLASSFLDGGYAVNAATPHQAEAVEFVRFLASPEFGQQLTDLLANISPIAGVVPTDPLLQEVAEFNRNATPYVFLVGFRYENPTGSTLVQQALPEMLAGNITPEEVGRRVTEGIATYYQPFQNR
ncbi:MAG: extracellular solute-binding protein [Deinococcus sp.]|nr:extracellular solute-binding protein [Deinococcus sp.]